MQSHNRALRQHRTVKIRAVPAYAQFPFLKNFKWTFVRMDPAKFEVRSISLYGILLYAPEIIAVAVLG